MKQAEYNLQVAIPTRYPDAVAPPAIPAEIYTEKDAKEALELAMKIINKVKEKIK